MRCKTEAAGARFARHILRAMVSRLVEKRRALQSEVRHMESERAMLTVQLQLLLGQAASAGSTEDAATAAARNAETASLILLDEAEARHAKLLAERRRAHLSVVGSLQREYIQALHTIKDEGFGPEGASPPGTRLELMMITPGAATGTDTPSATGASEAYEGGTVPHAHCSTAATFTPGFTPGETAHSGTPGAVSYGLETPSMLVPAAAFSADEVQTRQSRMQKEIFMLEQQLQRLKDQVLGGDNALAAAEGAQLQLRGLAAAAEEAKAEAEARRDEAETRAQLATEERDAARREVAELRSTIADAGGAERRWLEERNELRAALLEMAERRQTELHAMRTEHERAVRALEERLAFETASREYDRTEAQQLAAALKAMQAGASAGSLAVPSHAAGHRAANSASNAPSDAAAAVATTSSAGGSGVDAAASRKEAKKGFPAQQPAAARGGGGGGGSGSGGSASIAAAGSSDASHASRADEVADDVSSVAAAPSKGKARRAAVQEQPQAEGAVAPGSGFGKKAVQRASIGGGASSSTEVPSARSSARAASGTGGTPRKAGGAKGAKKPVRRSTAASTPLGK